ncbi:HesA/MoeB/ThiF family protein [Myxococcota bacterium]|nr:HesA/MoeB/ThiF family protein [Myxococcota bacterium]MBU1536732.1 HesA/MoeB/ThiF family protein [Myxococcota bacterium]
MEHLTDRYERNLALKDLGPKGQQLLGQARVLVVGAGGLGSPVIYYLAAAGIGTLGIMDADVVEPSNLNRQILHGEDTLGTKKAHSAALSAKRLNSSITIRTHDHLLTPENALEVIGEYDMVVDCVDSFEAKFLINDACVLASKPFVHCGVLGWGGQIFTRTPQGPCLRCLMPEIPGRRSDPEVGILGAAAGAMGAMEAVEVIKFITGAGSILGGRLLLGDLLLMNFHEVAFNKNPHCPVCGENPDVVKLTAEHYLPADRGPQ